MILGTIVVIIYINEKIPGGIGLTIALIAGISLALGVLLVYWNLVDWLNLRLVRRLVTSGDGDLKDGTVAAFSGIVRQDDAPMISPFGGVACAAYTYMAALAGSGSSQTRSSSHRRLLAQGFHMNRTRIESATRSVRLCALPGFEDDLRQDLDGQEWAEKTAALLAAIEGSASAAGQVDAHGHLLEARHTTAEELHQDFRSRFALTNEHRLVIQEEVLPVDQPVCVVGTYDEKLDGLTARRARLGPNLMVYQGSAEEVIARVGKDLIWFARITVVLIAIGLAGLAAAIVMP